MRIFLSHNPPKDKSYSHASNIAVLDGMVLDSEATDIVCDSFISSFDASEVKPLIDKICSKMRLGSTLTIKEVDSNIICKRLYLEEINIQDVNIALFKNQKRKSILNLETLHQLLPSSLGVAEKYYDTNNCCVVMKCRRQQ